MPAIQETGVVAAAEARMEEVRADIRLCNCGRCGALLRGHASGRAWRHLPEAVRRLFPADAVAGRLDDRPACPACVRAANRKTGHPPPAKKFPDSRLP